MATIPAATTDATADVAAPTTTDTVKTAKVASGDVVAYIGTADVREIDAAAWRNVGVNDQSKVVWDKSNKHQVSVADLSAAALEYFENDPGFVVRPANVK